MMNQSRQSRFGGLLSISRKYEAQLVYKPTLAEAATVHMEDSHIPEELVVVVDMRPAVRGLGTTLRRRMGPGRLSTMRDRLPLG